jgi:hypothetical protein
MKFALPGHGSVEIEGVTPASVAALRLVQYHAPKLIVSVITPTGTLRVEIKDIDLSPSFKQAETVNQDRAQLAKLGG